MHPVNRFFARFSMLVALGIAACVGPAAAQEYPTKPIRWIVPHAPGGGADSTARYLASRMDDLLGGQSFIVENRPGAAGMIGLGATAKAAPDGHTIAIAIDTLVSNQFLAESVPYEVSDFSPISVLVASPLVMLVRSDSSVKTLEEAIEWMKANDGKLTYGSWGQGSTPHLAMEELSGKIGVNMIHVPYQGAAASVVALLGGHLDFLLTSANVAIQHVREGKLRALAVTTREPIPQLPGVPTVAEKFPGFEAVAWIGVVGPKGIPAPVIAKLSNAFAKELKDPEVIQSFIDRGEIIVNKSPEEFQQLLVAETARIKEIVEKRGLSMKK